MKSIFWDAASFSISMKSQYNDLYELEGNINNFSGSSNFSEIDSLDWFLIDKKTKEITFLLLSIPSYFYQSYDVKLFDINKLHSIDLSKCLDTFVSKVTTQDIAYFLSKENHLIVASNLSLISHKTFIFDDLYFLLDDDLSYQGFLLENAINHIPSNNNLLDENILKSIFERMFSLCNQDSYDAMDKKDRDCLNIIEKLEKDCLSYKDMDDRLIHIIEFMKNIKYTFYDIYF